MCGIFLKNTSTWVITENACYYLNITTIPLYDTLNNETLEYIINQTELQTVVCSSKELEIIMNISKNCPTLKTIILSDTRINMDINTSKMNDIINVTNSRKMIDTIETMKRLGIELILFTDLANLGKEYPSPPSPPSGLDIATICYTSGTTGKVSLCVCVCVMCICTCVWVCVCMYVCMRVDTHCY